MFSNFLLTNIDDKDSAKELQRIQQKIVDELRKQCKSFNKERIISQLNNGYQIDRAFHLHVPNEIKHIARKHGLSEVKWDQIYQNLVAENIDDQTKILLAQAIKYSIKNNTVSVKPTELLEVLRKNNDALVKSEFVWALSYQLSNSFAKDSKEIINENFIDEINSIIEGSENKLNRSSVIFLNDQLQRYFYGNHLDYRQSSHVRIKTSVNYSKKMPQKFVTKNQQTTKIKYKSTQSEESADKLNSVNVFKNLNKKIKMNSNIESLPTIPDKDGSDTSIFRDTYQEVVHLYNTIKSGKTLKKMDTDVYLPSNYSRGLNEAQLENYVDLINDPHYSSDLKLEALRSIVLTVEKKQKLSDFLIEALINNINQIDDKFDNFIIVTLGIVSEKQIITKIDKLSIKLLDDWVIVGEGTDITFEKSSKDTSDCQSISSIVAQIFVKSLQNNVKIAEESLEYLAKALNSNDKQTRILSAKSLYLTLKTHRIKNNVLLELREHVEDRIPDVSVYSIVVYANSLAKLSKLQQPIIRSHIEFLPTIYVFEDLRLGEESFADEVNQNILYVLMNDDKIEKFEDNVFQIFDHILLFENHHQADVIDILRRYSAARHPIPESTIFALENVVDIPEFSNKVLEVFENMIKNKQIVSDKILHIFVDTLYLSDNEQLREKSF
ncbi:unnamed protein product, partial [Rotaria magnacalcarata]